MSSKAELRQRLRAIRRALSSRGRSAASDTVQRHIAELVMALGATSVATYAAHGSELDVTALDVPGLALAWPRVHLADGARPDQLVFHVAPRAALRPGYRGLLEPPRNCPVATTLDVVLVPALAFDRAGRRLGQGGGFYDRAIAALRLAPRPPLIIGVGFASQLVDVLFDEPHDQRVDLVVTEDGVVVDRRALDPEPVG